MKAQLHIPIDGKPLPWGFWQNTRNHRVYFDWLGSQIGIKKYQDWYDVKSETLKEYPGATTALSKIGKNSLPQTLMNVYPEFEWDLYKFRHTSRTTRGYYKDKSNVIQLLTTIASKLGVSRLEDWYDIPANELRDFGGKGLLQAYNDSMIQLLSAAYPDYPWKPWLFVGGVKNGYWESMENQRSYLDWLSHELGINTFDAWRTVSWRDVMIRGGTSLLKKYGSFLKLFSAVYPEHDWRATFGSHNTMLFKQKSQMTLLKVVNELFPDDKVLVNYRHPDLQFDSGRNMELDIYIPSRNLALEYQGEQHYFPTSFEKNVVTLQERDEEKRKGTTQLGITLVTVPYWWDRQKTSLALTLSAKRPDLQFPFIDQIASTRLSFTLNPIPERPPKMVGYETNVQPLFAQVYNPKIDPRGWWMSEKYDGVRAYWDGKVFLSKNKFPLTIPPDIVHRMPPYPLDGEIWLGHGTVAESMKIVRKAKSVDWSKFQFMIFDAPLHPGVFEDRYQFLMESIPPDHPFAKVVPMIQCGSRKELQKYLQDILSQGGEGVMLRQPQSAYHSGRSASLLKVKPYKDAEAVVVSASPEMKHWECKLANGLIFPVVNRSQLQQKVHVGSLVTFRHSGFYLNGRPRTPYILNTRDDLTVLRYLVDNHHFWASKRKQTGICHSCKKELQEIRICVEATSQLDSSALSTLSTIEFCPTSACIHTDDPSLKIPPFKDTVVVPSSEDSDAAAFTDEEVTMGEVKAIQPNWKWIATSTFAKEVERTQPGNDQQ